LPRADHDDQCASRAEDPRTISLTDHWRKVAGAAALLSAAALVASCTTAGTPVAQRGPAPAPPAAAPAPTTAAPSAAPDSDEDQVRDALLAFMEAYNTQNWDAYKELMCAAMRQQFTGPVMDMLKKTRADQGLTTGTLKSVTVDGDKATATVDAQNELLGSKTLTLPLIREDGWKICVPPDGLPG
jgi:predicted lipid-binding transport protein (Tim44 family)